MLEKIDFNKYIEEGKVSGRVAVVPRVVPTWVKKRVLAKDWTEHYVHLSSYCFLEKESSGKVWVGFLVANQIPRVPASCEECNDEDLRKIDMQRRAVNQWPVPMTIGARVPVRDSSFEEAEQDALF